MDAKERKLAEAAASLTARDFRYLREHGMLPGEGAASPTSPSREDKVRPQVPRTAGAGRPSRARKRRRIAHRWPEVGTILEADYHGVHYEAEVVAAPRYRSGKAVRILSGPAAGQLCRSLSGAMLRATQEQRRRERLGNKGVSNGWSFWRVADEQKS